MKKGLRSVISIILVLNIFLFSTNVLAIDSMNSANHKDYKAMSYDFPVKPGTMEWNNLSDYVERVKVCQIPEDILKKMSTASLVETVLNYPLYGNIYAYNTPLEGLNTIVYEFNGLAELLERNDVVDILMDFYKAMNPLKVKELTTNLQKGEYAVRLSYLETLLSHEKITSRLTTNQKENFKNETNKKLSEKKSQRDVYSLTLETTYRIMEIYSIEPQEVTETVRTPMDTQVTVIVNSTELTESEKTWNENYVKTRFPEAKILAPATRKYNCHSYAWYLMSPNNPYWMNDPMAYMNDTSYAYVGRSQGVGANGLKMYYEGGNHSAYLTNTTGYNYSDMTCVSKWGELPLMEHKAPNCPYWYNTEYIKFYKQMVF